MPVFPESLGHIQHALPPYPRQVRLESSSFCNARCPWCHGHGATNPLIVGAKGMTRPKGRMDFALVERLVSEMAGWTEPLRELVPTNFGEWFLHPRWHDMGKLFERLLPRTAVVVVTTGILLRAPGALEKLADIQTVRWVNFSLNAFYRDTWSRIHGAPAHVMDEVLGIILALRAVRPDIRLNVSMVYDSITQTESERDLFVSFWQQQGIPVSVSVASYAQNPLRKPMAPVVQSCRSVFDGLTVFSDGVVGTGCCFDADHDAALQVGRVPEERLLDIWRGEKLRHLSDLHNSGRRTEIGICRDCTFA